jgi:hypothetical protein
MPSRTWTFRFPTAKTPKPQEPATAACGLLPRPETLRSFRKHTEAAAALSEYWFFPDLSREDQRKPIYGWAGGQPPAAICEDDSLQFDVSWDYLKSATWEQMVGASALPDGLPSGMTPDSRLVRVLTLGEAYLMSATYLDDGDEEHPSRQLWRKAFAAGTAQHPLVGIEPAQNSGWSAKAISTFRCPLEFLEPEPRVRRIRHADGRPRCLIVGFAIRPEHPKQLPGFGEPGTIVHSIAATDEDPAGLEMLELFLVQYRLLYKNYVEPARGKPTMLTPQPTYSFQTAQDWSDLDARRLPTVVPDHVSAEELTKAYTELMLRAGLQPVAKQPSPQEDDAVLPEELVACAVAVVANAFDRFQGLGKACAISLLKAVGNPLHFLMLFEALPAKGTPEPLRDAGITDKQCSLMREAWKNLGGMAGTMATAQRVLSQMREDDE